MKRPWIVIFFVVLPAHLIGIFMSGQFTDVQRKGGRSYKIALAKNADRKKVRRDLQKEFSGESPSIKFFGTNRDLDFTTTYLINRRSPETDSIVFRKLMKGLKEHLPSGITYEMFDSTYKLGQTSVLPSAPAREPAWYPRTLYPILLFVCKALLMPLLLIFFLVSVKRKSSPLKRWIAGALLFSWVGDVLLMFVPKNETFFLAGLGSFLLAHIFYIFYFHKIKTGEKVRSKPLLLVIVAAYYTLLITVLLPYLGDMKIPVLVYGIVISFMFLLALHMLYLKNRTAGKWMMTGAMLFVISDSLLAINKFYQPFTGAGLLVILTYAIAQLFIVEGAARFINEET